MEWKARGARGPHSLERAEESLDELGELAASAGAQIVGRVFQSRVAVEAATLVGQGKVEEIAAAVRAANVDTVIFDHDLTPTQQRNLEKVIGSKVIDRTQLILDIFASRARTREGRLQVELAQLNYLLPRLAGRGAEMSRLGGGIGTRGPGETQLERDRRRIGRRIKKLEDELEGVRAGRALHRRRRRAVPLATLALAGYTNVGKSTLFNRLTRAGVLADSRMFATLDPTIRPLVLPSRRRVLVSDTVGFIRNLPTTLVKAFRATLEEVKEAALILHVLDVAAPSAPEHAAHVRRVLAEIGAAEIPQLLVLNKLDRLSEKERDCEAVRRRLLASEGCLSSAQVVAVSALTGAGIEQLLTQIDEMLQLDRIVRTTLRLPLSDAITLARLYEFGRVVAVRYGHQYCEVEVDIPESIRRQFLGAN